MRFLPRLAFSVLVAAALHDLPAHAAATASNETAHSTDGSAVTIDVAKDSTSSKALPLTVESISQPPTAGTAQIVSNKIVYTPGATFVGSDSFKYTISDGDGAAATGTVTIAPTAITAKNDYAVIADGQPVAISVLKNDVDPDGNKLSIKKVGTPGHGSVTVDATGQTITYTPDASFTGSDSFTYTVQDAYSVAQATVTIFAPLTAAVGAAGLAIKDASGNVVGFMSIDVLTHGIFSGQIELRGTRYALLGAFDAVGNFTGIAHGDHGMLLPVHLTIDGSGTTPVVSASFPTGDSASQSISTITAVGRVATQGRYTVLFQASGTSSSTTSAAAVSTTGTTTNTTTTGTTATGTSSTGTTTTTTDRPRDSTPDGIGWMTMRIDSRGYARIKGVAGDGNKFSSLGVLGGSDTAPTMVLFAASKVSALAGTLAFSSTGVSGDFVFNGEPRAKRYPNGFNVSATATGAAYSEPDGSLFSGGATVAVSGGRFTSFSTSVSVDSDGRATELNKGTDALNLKIYTRDGTFSGNFRDPDRSHRYAKFTGVVVQGTTTSGGGVFLGDEKAGQVTVTAGSGQ